jgi:hypothetical protein
MKVLPTKGEGLSLVGFRINPVGRAPDLYTIIVYNGKDSPITIDRQIAFISRPEHATKLYKLFNKRLKALGPAPTEVDLVCDIPATLNIIRRKNRDGKATILNCLNTMFDLLAAVKVQMPGECKSLLYNLADHLTFNREFGDFITEQNISRESITYAILWCVGALAVNAKIVFQSSRRRIN